MEDYASSGSGSVIAFGVLETQYSKDMTVDEGIRLAVKSVNAALQRDSASGNGIDVVKITSKGVERVFGEEIETKIELKK